MKKRVIMAMMLALSTLVAGVALATPLTADEIIERANRAAYYAGDDGQAEVKMTITSQGGDVRVREFALLRRNEEDGIQKFYTYFKAPADVNKMAYLVWKKVDGDDDRWLWLPALNLKKRIAPGDKRTSFVGSDFVYEDVSGRSPREDSHVLIEQKEAYFLIENIPKDPSSVEFSRYTVRIDSATFLPIVAEYYDRSGRLYRRVAAVQIETIQGLPTVTVAEASDLISGSVTRNEFSDVRYNIGLQSQIFTERFLRRPPREVMR